MNSPLSFLSSSDLNISHLIHIQSIYIYPFHPSSLITKTSRVSHTQQQRLLFSEEKERNKYFKERTRLQYTSFSFHVYNPSIHPSIPLGKLYLSLSRSLEKTRMEREDKSFVRMFYDVNTKNRLSSSAMLCVFMFPSQSHDFIESKEGWVLYRGLRLSRVF
jgi:hypothetical protein